MASTHSDHARIVRSRSAGVHAPRGRWDHSRQAPGLRQSGVMSVSLRVSAMLVMWVLRVRSSTVLGRSDAGRHDVLCADPSSVRQEPAGRAAPVDRARQPTPMLPPGDPELAARRCSSLPPWGRDLVHRLAPGGVGARKSVVGAELRVRQAVTWSR